MVARPIPTKEQIIDKFWSYVDKTDDCWNWQGSKTVFGYGQFASISKYGIFNSNRSHRIAYFLANGVFDTSLEVCHKCDNRSCVNPKHLFLDTHSGNMKDCANKGRLNTQTITSGEKHGQSKLTLEQVREIRILYSKGGVSQKNLGERFGVSTVTISMIIRNKTWVE